MEQPFSTEVMCPIKPAPPGWERLRAEHKPTVARLFRYLTQLPDFLDCLHIVFPGDKSIGVFVFPEENYEMTAEHMRQLYNHPDLAGDILQIEFNTSCRAVVRPEVCGAMVVYLRTAQYNNAHPGSVARAPGQSALTTSTKSSVNAETTELVNAGGRLLVRRDLPGVSKADRIRLNEMGNQLLLLQGLQFQPSTQSILRLTDGRYQIRTIGFVRPITLDQLEMAESLPHVQRIHINFHMESGRDHGALIATCQLPRTKRTQGAAELDNSSVSFVGRWGRPESLGASADFNADFADADDDDDDSDDDQSMKHAAKRRANSPAMTIPADADEEAIERMIMAAAAAHSDQAAPPTTQSSGWGLRWLASMIKR